MHRYRTVAQISLTLSIINLVLAAPIVVQEIHEARGDEIVVAEGVSVAAMAKKVARARGSIGQVNVSPLTPGCDGICAAFVFVGRVDVSGLSRPVFVVGFVTFRLFVVVGEAAASEPSSIIARVGISSPFKFRVIGATAISTTYGVGFGDY
jgi:hypothetical protein